LRLGGTLMKQQMIFEMLLAARGDPYLKILKIPLS
jgi:hypothetical protein